MTKSDLRRSESNRSGRKSLIKEVQSMVIARELNEPRDPVVRKVLLKMWQKIACRCRILRKLRRASDGTVSERRQSAKRRHARPPLCASLEDSFLSFYDLLCCFYGFIYPSLGCGISRIDWMGMDWYDGTSHRRSWILGIYVVDSSENFPYDEGVHAIFPDISRSVDRPTGLYSPGVSWAPALSCYTIWLLTRVWVLLIGK